MSRQAFWDIGASSNRRRLLNRLRSARLEHLEPRQLLSAGNWNETSAATLDSQTTTPQVVSVVLRADASPWASGFLERLNSLAMGDGGYLIPGDSAGQLRPVPWSNVDQISIAFSTNVVVQSDDLSIWGVNTPQYDLTSTADQFTYDPTTFIATWTLPTKIGNDKLLLQLRSDATNGVHSPAGESLDGEWTSTLDGQYPSGDGTAGGEFQFRLNVLPGDIDGNGVVNFGDAQQVRSRVGDVLGSQTYDVLRDIDGNGVINFGDAQQVRGKVSTQLPAAEPQAPQPPESREEFFLRLTGKELTDPALGPVVLDLSQAFPTENAIYPNGSPPMPPGLPIALGLTRLGVQGVVRSGNGIALVPEAHQDGRLWVRLNDGNPVYVRSVTVHRQGVTTARFATELGGMQSEIVEIGDNIVSQVIHVGRMADALFMENPGWFLSDIVVDVNPVAPIEAVTSVLAIRMTESERSAYDLTQSVDWTNRTNELAATDSVFDELGDDLAGAARFDTNHTGDDELAALQSRYDAAHQVLDRAVSMTPDDVVLDAPRTNLIDLSLIAFGRYPDDTPFELNRERISLRSSNPAGFAISENSLLPLAGDLASMSFIDDGNNHRFRPVTQINFGLRRYFGFGGEVDLATPTGTMTRVLGDGDLTLQFTIPELVSSITLRAVNGRSAVLKSVEFNDDTPPILLPPGDPDLPPIEPPTWLGWSEHDPPALLDPVLESAKYDARSASVEMTPVTIDRTDLGIRLDAETAELDALDALPGDLTEEQRIRRDELLANIPLLQQEFADLLEREADLAKRLADAASTVANRKDFRLVRDTVSLSNAAVSYDSYELRNNVTVPLTNLGGQVLLSAWQGPVQDSSLVLTDDAPTDGLLALKSVARLFTIDLSDASHLVTTVRFTPQSASGAPLVIRANRGDNELFNLNAPSGEPCYLYDAEGISGVVVEQALIPMPARADAFRRWIYAGHDSLWLKERVDEFFLDGHQYDPFVPAGYGTRAAVYFATQARQYLWEEQLDIMREAFAGMGADALVVRELIVDGFGNLPQVTAAPMDRFNTFAIGANAGLDWQENENPRQAQLDAGRAGRPAGYDRVETNGISSYTRFFALSTGDPQFPQSLGWFDQTGAFRQIPQSMVRIVGRTIILPPNAPGLVFGMDHWIGDFHRDIDRPAWTDNASGDRVAPLMPPLSSHIRVGARGLTNTIRETVGFISYESDSIPNTEYAFGNAQVYFHLTNVGLSGGDFTLRAHVGPTMSADDPVVWETTGNITAQHGVGVTFHASPTSDDFILLEVIHPDGHVTSAVINVPEHHAREADYRNIDLTSAELRRLGHTARTVDQVLRESNNSHIVAYRNQLGFQSSPYFIPNNGVLPDDIKKAVAASAQLKRQPTNAEVAASNLDRMFGKGTKIVDGQIYDRHGILVPGGSYYANLIVDEAQSNPDTQIHIDAAGHVSYVPVYVSALTATGEPVGEITADLDVPLEEPDPDHPITASDEFEKLLKSLQAAYGDLYLRGDWVVDATGAVISDGGNRLVNYFKYEYATDPKSRLHVNDSDGRLEILEIPVGGNIIAGPTVAPPNATDLNRFIDANRVALQDLALDIFHAHGLRPGYADAVLKWLTANPGAIDYFDAGASALRSATVTQELTGTEGLASFAGLIGNIAPQIATSQLTPIRSPRLQNGSPLAVASSSDAEMFLAAPRTFRVIPPIDFDDYRATLPADDTATYHFKFTLKVDRLVSIALDNNLFRSLTVLMNGEPFESSPDHGVTFGTSLSKLFHPGDYEVVVSSTWNMDPASTLFKSPAQDSIYSHLGATSLRFEAKPFQGQSQLSGLISVAGDRYTPTVLLSKVILGSNGPIRDYSPIEVQTPTIIVIHGRSMNDGVTDPLPNLDIRQLLADACRLASKIDGQVLAVDWREPAGDRGISLRGAAWTETVGEWLANRLVDLGITPSSTTIIAHSWGTYVAFFAARTIQSKVGTVRAIIALDPASNVSTLNGVTSIPFSEIDFHQVANASLSIKASIDLDRWSQTAKSGKEALLQAMNPLAPRDVALFNSIIVNRRPDDPKEYGDDNKARSAGVACEIRVPSSIDLTATHSAPLRLFSNLVTTLLSRAPMQLIGSDLDVRRFVDIEIPLVLRNSGGYDFRITQIADNLFYLNDLDVYL